jgi:histone H2A
MAPKKKTSPPPPTAGAGRGEKKKRVTLSDKSGLVFPVARTLNKLKRGKYANRVRKGAGVYLASVLEYLAAEVLELAGNEARDTKKKRITPRHIQLAVRCDEELSKVFDGVIIPDGGVIPHINNFLLPRQKPSKK